MNWEQLLCEDRPRTNRKVQNSTDFRSEFEKDYHRIIGSASFRRLQDKTQVFPLDNSDFIRTRLTHSLEVSSLAKSLGQSVGNALFNKGLVTRDQEQAMADILLCAGLLHDIGNPPFGHFGENVIREWFCEELGKKTYKGKPLKEWLTNQQAEDLCCFEGNAQSLRVVTRLHHLVDDNGMNLTKGLLNTIIKYPVPSDGIDKRSDDIRLKKMGYFYADGDNFTDIVESTGAKDRRHPLVYLLEAADDIAYSTADLEDGFKKGIISFSKLLYLIENNPYKDMLGKKEYEDCAYSAVRMKKLWERGMENGEPDPELYAVQNFVVTMQSLMIKAVVESFIEHYDEIMEGTYKKDLFYGTSSEILSKVLKETAYNHIFQSNGIVKLEVAADCILRSLLDKYVEAAIKYDTGLPMTDLQEKLILLISPNYRKIYEKAACGKSEGERLYLRLLLVTDTISGMTDHYAKSLYQEFQGIY